MIHKLHTLYFTKILEVNLFAFAYRLFHRDFSPINGTYCMGTHSFFPALYVFYVNLGGFYEWVVLIFHFLITGKSVHPDSKLGRSRLSLLTSSMEQLSSLGPIQVSAVYCLKLNITPVNLSFHMVISHCNRGTHGIWPSIDGVDISCDDVQLQDGTNGRVTDEEKVVIDSLTKKYHGIIVPWYNCIVVNFTMVF